MSITHLDYETSSACDITFGGYRYASDPSTRILMFAVARGDDEPVLWRFDEPDSDESKEAKAILELAIIEGDAIYAHNAAGFEFPVSKYCLKRDVGIDPPSLEQWRCTAAMCRTASIPYSLAKAAEFLNLGVDKDASGKALIGIFSDQSKVITLRHGKETLKSNSPILESEIPWDHTMTVAGNTVSVRDAWESFCSYCKQDVRVEQRLHHKLSAFEITGSELDGFHFDISMNDKGVPVNVPAVRHAQTIVGDYRDFLTKQFINITGLNPSQTAKVLEWLQERGYPADNLQAKTMQEMAGSSFMTDEANEALRMRAELSFVAVKKLDAMANIVCPDDRLRGQFMWYGASATGRWSSQGVQMQNARRPTIENHADAYKAICAGEDPEIFGMLYGNPFEAVASCIRNFVRPEQGRMLDLDLANIESRCAAWLAGQEDLLDAYRQGRDAYKELASDVYGVPVDEVTKEQRFVGKVGNLSLVFQTGAKTFHETCAAWGMPIEKKIAIATVKTFREKNSMFPKTWRAYESAAVDAINTPGKWFQASSFVKFARTLKEPFDRLLMKLPSGRCLVYPLPRVARAVKRHQDYETGEVREWETNEITYYGGLKGYTGWGRVGLYAGLLYQNSVQATARDILQHGCLVAQERGFNIWAVIHDQCLADEGDPDEFAAAICSHPSWLPDDFPLKAESQLCDYYSK